MVKSDGNPKGFRVFGEQLAEVINATDTGLQVDVKNTMNSRQNLELLLDGQLDLAGHPWKMCDNIQVRKENDYYKYLVGPFDTIDDAELIKTKLTGDGFEQAFVVAYRENARVSLQELAKEGQ